MGRTVRRRRRQSRRHRQIRRRLTDPQSTGDVQINVVRVQPQPAARFQHRQQHRQPPAIPPDHRPARRSAGVRRQQRLHLHQHRARTLQPGEHRTARDIAPPLRQKQRRGIGNLRQTDIGHLKHADFVGGAKAVLHPAQNTELMPAVAFKIQHRIHHVLQHPRPGDRALFGHMPNQDQRKPLQLGHPDQLETTGANL